MNPTRILIAILLFVLILEAHGAAQEDIRPGVLILGEESGAMSPAAVVAAARWKAGETFSSLGRFYPATVTDGIIPQGATDVDIVARGKEAGCRLVISISCSTDGRFHYLLLRVRALEPDYRRLEGDIRLRSRVPACLPLLAAREIAWLHEGLPLPVNITGRTENGIAIDAGQWHGLLPGVYRLEGGGSVTVLSTGRYTSICKGDVPADRHGFTLLVYPVIKQQVRDSEDDINGILCENMGFASMLPGSDPRQRFAEALCIVNPGANICLPGYGAYLATSYMGFQHTKPDTAGIVISASTVFLHVMTPVFATGFRGNFFPWIQDSDKSNGVYRGGIFLWSTLPLAFSAAFLDSLSVQNLSAGKVPPFFNDRDRAAAALSCLIPGGGLFYKGYRSWGWFYYLTEIPLGAAGCWMGSGRGAIAAFSVLGLIKTIDIIHAWMAEPAYPFFMQEFDRGRRVNVMPGISLSPGGEPVMRLGVSIPLE